MRRGASYNTYRTPPRVENGGHCRPWGKRYERRSPRLGGGGEDWGRGERAKAAREGPNFLVTRAHVRGRFQIFLVRSEYILFAVDLIATCMVGRSRPPGARAAREEKIHENVRSVLVQIFRPRSRRCFSDIPCSFGISVIQLSCSCDRYDCYEHCDRYVSVTFPYPAVLVMVKKMPMATEID